MKLLGGCLIVAVIAAIGLSVAGFYAYRAARPMLDSAGSYLDRVREITRLGEDVRDKSSYTAPATGELTPDQVDRFIAVQTRVRAELNDQWGQVEQQAATIRAKAESGSREWTLAEFSTLFSSVGGVYLQGRRAQVVALNVQRFSEEEYQWVRRRVFAAAGLQLAGSIDLSSLENLVRDGAARGGITLPETPSPDVPEVNVRLVQPHAAKLKEWLPMAAIGL